MPSYNWNTRDPARFSDFQNTEWEYSTIDRNQVNVNHEVDRIGQLINNLSYPPQTSDLDALEILRNSISGSNKLSKKSKPQKFITHSLPKVASQLLQMIFYLDDYSGLGNLVRSSFNNYKYALKWLYKFIPTDTGFEFEIGSENMDLIPRNVLLELSRMNSKVVKDSGFELTMRMKSWHDLQDLNRFLQVLRKYTRLPNEGGIHIHCNVPNLHLKDKPKELKDYINRYYLTELKFLNDEFFKYKGHYNEVRAACSKGYTLNIRSDFNTLEWRGINMTYSMPQLLSYIIACHRYTTLFISSFKYKYQLDSIIWTDLLDKC